ncbi:MAG: PIN domain-containing protein [Bryobacteraceae bacterium]
MKASAFIDTNVFLYTDDDEFPDKKAVAIALVADHQRSGLALVSMQVLQEYFAAATRKLGVAPDLAQRKVELMARLRVVRLMENDVIAAIEFHRLHGTSFWDSLIIQAARLGGASLLYTEDMQHGAMLAGIRIVNPFLPRPCNLPG